MNRNERTHVLVESQSLAALLAKEIKADPSFTLEMPQEPKLGMLMTKVRESGKNSLFYAGEVLITQAEMLVNGMKGQGMLLGEDLNKAKDLAIIDASYEQLEPQRKVLWESRLINEQARLLKDQEVRQGQLNQTKVDFDIMEVEE